MKWTKKAKPEKPSMNLGRGGHFKPSLGISNPCVVRYELPVFRPNGLLQWYVGIDWCCFLLFWLRIFTIYAASQSLWLSGLIGQSLTWCAHETKVPYTIINTRLKNEKLKIHDYNMTYVSDNNPTYWVVSTYLKNISQIGSSPQIAGWKYKIFELPPS